MDNNYERIANFTVSEAEIRDLIVRHYAKNKFGVDWGPLDAECTVQYANGKLHSMAFTLKKLGCDS